MTDDAYKMNLRTLTKRLLKALFPGVPQTRIQAELRRVYKALAAEQQAADAEGATDE